MDNEGAYTPASEEALFMLVSCSAFLNYLCKKSIDMDIFKWELLIACFLLGACTASFVLFLFCDINVYRKNNLTTMINRILMWIPRLWYPLILILSTVYVCCNFSDCLNFQFFSDFSG